MSLDQGAVAAGAIDELFRDLPTKATRRAIWSQVFGVVTRREIGQALVVMRMPDAVQVVASTDPNWKPGTAIPDAAMVASCFREGQPQFLSPEGRDGVVALLPLKERGEVVAVMRIEGDEPLVSSGFEELTSLAFAVSACLTERSWTLEADLAAELSSRLGAVDNLTSGAAAALSAIVPALGASGGVLLEVRAGRLFPLADYGEHAIARRAFLEEGIPIAASWLMQGLQQGGATFSRDYHADPGHLPGLPINPVVLALPLDHRGATRNVLIVTYAEEDIPAEADLTILRAACRVLAGLMGGLREADAQDRLFELLEHLLDQPVEGLYQRALEVAVDTVPGAERGTFLVREGLEGPFTYRASVGYDLEVLRDLSATEEQARSWFALGANSWGRGKPRVAQASATNLVRLGWMAGVDADVDTQGKLHAIKANLCIPILEGGRVRAVMNLDSTVREDAFAQDSIRVANQVAIATSSILRVARDHEAARTTAITDPVTGMRNRRGAERAFEQALARALRDDEPLSVLVMDLGGFKKVNDTLGHAKGDHALRLVAQELQQATRAGDVVARWGGDEFIAILPRQAADDVDHVVRRLARTVAKLRVGERHLSIHIGAATFPADAVTMEGLLAVADERMYNQKRGAPEVARG